VTPGERESRGVAGGKNEVDVEGEVDGEVGDVTDLVVTSSLTSADVNLTSGSRSPDETDGAVGSVTHSIFVRFTSNFVHLHPLPPVQERVMSRFSLINFSPQNSYLTGT
jgi:hypothetical protein